jgi:ribonuclease HII
MPLLIATDEAGYGPRLGPLVIVATAWRLQPEQSLPSAHRKLAQPIAIDGFGKLRIDDSKRIFARRKTVPAIQSKSSIDLLTDAAAIWAAMPLPSGNYRQWLLELAAGDVDDLGAQPWFASLSHDAQTADGPIQVSLADESIHHTKATGALINHWRRGGLQLIAIAARIIDAARFNCFLDIFANKADLLSHMTCELALTLWQKHRDPVDLKAYIYSDRHGGRAYYGGLLQHHCPELTMQVIHESSQCSSYRLCGAECFITGTESIDWSFTVGGDSYPPVALSSIIAKSTRERLMALFNEYFQVEAKAHKVFCENPLRPTAGYAVDATRFLEDIRPICTQRSFADAVLIRKR